MTAADKLSPLEKAARAVRDALFSVRPGREVTHEEIARAVLLAVRGETCDSAAIEFLDEVIGDAASKEDTEQGRS